MNKVVLHSPWVVKDGSIFTEQKVKMRSEFPGNKTNYEVPVAVAFNVGEDLAKHIVKLHNDSLQTQVTQIFGPWWGEIDSSDGSKNLFVG